MYLLRYRRFLCESCTHQLRLLKIQETIRPTDPSVSVPLGP